MTDSTNPGIRWGEEEDDFTSGSSLAFSDSVIPTFSVLAFFFTTRSKHLA